MRKTLTEYFHAYRHLRNQQRDLPPGDRRATREITLDRIHRNIIRAEVEYEKGKAIDDILDRIHQLIIDITN